MKNVDTSNSPTDDQSLELSTTSGGSHGRRGHPWRCRWLLLTLVLALFFSIGHLAGAYQKEEEILRAKAIAAEKFELRGPDGKLRASLLSGSKDEALLSFFDANGHSRLIMGMDAKGAPIISFFDEKQAMKMGLSLDPGDGTPQIAFLDDHGEPAIHLGITKGFGPDVSIGNAGRGRIAIFVTKEGSPAIQLLDQKNRPRISLAVADYGPAISLLGDDQVVRAIWRVLPDGSPVFSLFDRQSRERLIVMTDKDGKPTIRFSDPDKKELRELK